MLTQENKNKFVQLSSALKVQGRYFIIDQSTTTQIVLLLYRKGEQTNVCVFKRNKMGRFLTDVKKAVGLTTEEFNRYKIDTSKVLEVKFKPVKETDYWWNHD